MYNFVFYFVYKFKERRANDLSDARFTALLAVIISLVFHLFMAISITKYAFEYKAKLFQFTNDKQVNRLIVAVVGILLIVGGAFYFNKKRANRIVAYFDERIKEIFSLKFIIIFLAITLLPLLVGIYFLNHQ